LYTTELLPVTLITDDAFAEITPPLDVAALAKTTLPSDTARIELPSEDTTTKANQHILDAQGESIWKVVIERNEILSPPPSEYALLLLTMPSLDIVTDEVSDTRTTPPRRYAVLFDTLRVKRPKKSK